jgi:flagella basal body P-ring formation protein FlgA
LILPLLLTFLHAGLSLKSGYEFSGQNVTSRTLFPELSKSFLLFTVPAGKDRHRVSAEEIARVFARHGIAVETGSERFINFTRHSPVDLRPIEAKIATYYATYYPGIRIRSVEVTPRSHTPALPAGCRYEFSDRSYKYDRGTMHAVTPDGEKYFFDYTVHGDVPVLRSVGKLKRETLLGPINTRSGTVSLAELRDLPLQNVPAGRYRLKRLLRDDAVILQRHVERAPLVIRGMPVDARLLEGSVLVQFRAEALQDGGLHDMISIQKPDGGRIKARVVGPNKVEIE